MPFSVALRVLPGALQATLAAGGGVAEAVAAGGAEQGGGAMGEETATAAAAAAALAAAAAGGAGGGMYGQIVRALPLMKIGMLMMAYIKLLTVKNGQLEDDVRILKGLKVRVFSVCAAYVGHGARETDGVCGPLDSRPFLETKQGGIGGHGSRDLVLMDVHSWMDSGIAVDAFGGKRC